MAKSGLCVDYREALINEVKSRAILWDPTLTGYKDAVLCNNAWQEIAEITGLTPSYAKKRFRNIRDAYRKRRKEHLTNQIKGHKDKYVTWKLFPLLTFLDEHMTIGVSGLFDDENSDDPSDTKSTIPSSSSSETRRPTQPKKGRLAAATTTMRYSRERLIDEVKAREYLWNPDHFNYNCPAAINRAWEDIGEATGLLPAEAKRQFKNIRDQYRRKRKELLMSRYRGDKVQPIKWKYYPMMTFLDPYMTVDLSSSMADALITVDDTCDEATDDGSVTCVSQSKPVQRPSPRKKCRLDNTERKHKSPEEPSRVQRKRKQFKSESGKRRFGAARIVPKTGNNEKLSGVSNEIVMSFLDSISDQLMDRLDSEGLYGRYVAETLRKLTPEMRSKARYCIQKVLYEMSNDKNEGGLMNEDACLVGMDEAGEYFIRQPVSKI